MFLPGPIVLYPAPSKTLAVRALASSKAPAVLEPASEPALGKVPVPGPQPEPKPAPDETPAVPDSEPKPAPGETASPVASGTAPVTAVQAAQKEKR